LLGFSDLPFGFFDFTILKKSQNLNCNPLVFDESKKIVQSGFLGVHKNRPISSGL
jgi:hypothetical protein